MSSIGALDNIFQVGEFKDRNDRTEDFLACDLHIVANVNEYRGLDEVALGAHSLSAAHTLGALRFACLDVAQNSLEDRSTADRTGRALLIERVADYFALRYGLQLGNELVVDALVDVDAARGTTRLLVAEYRHRCVFGRLLQRLVVDVEDYEWRFAA